MAGSIDDWTMVASLLRFGYRLMTL